MSRSILPIFLLGFLLFPVFCFLKFIYDLFWQTERVSRRGGERERERERESQAGSAPSMQSLMWGSNSRYGFKSYVQVFNPFELIYVYGKKGPSFILLCVTILISKHFLLRRLSYPHCILLATCHKYYVCMRLFLGSLFYSILFYSILFYSIDLCVCNKVWNKNDASSFVLSEDFSGSGGFSLFLCQI